MLQSNGKVTDEPEGGRQESRSLSTTVANFYKAKKNKTGNKYSVKKKNGQDFLQISKEENNISKHCSHFFNRICDTSPAISQTKQSLFTIASITRIPIHNNTFISPWLKERHTFRKQNFVFIFCTQKLYKVLKDSNFPCWHSLDSSWLFPSQGWHSQV